MIVTTKELFKLAYGKYAIGAYNINNLEQTMGLFEGNVRSKAPFIVQLSKGARAYTHKLMLEALMKTANEIFPEAIFAVHLDHGDEATCYDCIDSGVYSSVMIDASAFPYEENVAITKRVVDRAHAKGIEEDVKAAEHVYTRPEEVVDFVSKTGCDSLACAIGTSHGAFKFSGDQKLRYDILEEVQAKLPGFPLVMHGSSSVPQGEVARINAAGGQILGAKGVDATQFLGAAKRGVTKINIDTDGRLVWCRVHRELFRDKPAEFDLRKPGKIFMKEYADFIYEKNCLLGSAYRADEVRAALGK